MSEQSSKKNSISWQFRRRRPWQHFVWQSSCCVQFHILKKENTKKIKSQNIHENKTKILERQSKKIWTCLNKHNTRKTKQSMEQSFNSTANEFSRFWVSCKAVKSNIKTTKKTFWNVLQIEQMFSHKWSLEKNSNLL